MSSRVESSQSGSTIWTTRAKIKLKLNKDETKQQFGKIADSGWVQICPDRIKYAAAPQWIGEE